MFVTENIKPVEHVEKVKKPRKPRKPMSEEQKQVLRERLAKARAAKKAKKEGKVDPPKVVEAKTKAPKKEKVEMKIEEKTPIPTFKAEMVKPVPIKDEMAEMRAQLKQMQTRNKQQEKELLKAALEKEKLKKTGLDFLAKAKAAKQKPLQTIKEDVAESKPAVTIEQLAAPVKKRYSTYKKSIWAKFE